VQPELQEALALLDRLAERLQLECQALLELRALLAQLVARVPPER